MKSETRNIGKFKVNCFNILTTKTWICDVWEPTNMAEHSHSTITTYDGVWYGKVGSRRLTKEQDAMPVGPARFQMVDQHYAEQYKEAYELVQKAFPEIKNITHKEKDGEISFQQ